MPMTMYRDSSRVLQRGSYVEPASRGTRRRAMLLVALSAPLLLVACATPTPASGLDEARRLIAQGAYAKGLRLLEPWLLPMPGAASDPRRVHEARLLVSTVRLNCMTRGPDRDDPGFCARLAQLPEVPGAAAAPAVAEPRVPPAPMAVAVPASPLLPGADTAPAAPTGVVPTGRSAAAVPAPVMPDRRVGGGKNKRSGARQVPEPARARDASSASALPSLERPVSMQFSKAGLASVFGVIGIASGLEVVFDRDVPTDQRLLISLRNTPAHTALDKAALAAGLAWRQLDAHSVLVYPDSSRKQADYQALQVRSFFLEHADARFVAASLRTVLKSRDIVVDDKLNMLVLRDTAEAMRQTEQLIRLHDVPEPEVLLDVQVLEVKRSLLKQWGVQWPAQIGVLPLPLQLQAAGAAYDPGVPLTLRDLLSATPGRTGVQVSPLTLNARRDSGDINTLASPRLRAKNRERARILIGERVPNVTATSTATGLVAESVNYVDVGIKLEVQPQVFAGDEVLIRLDLEVSNIIDTTQTRSGTLAYRIGTRNANTVLRLRDGENQLLAGLIQDSDQRNGAQLPGLGELPMVGRLFGSQRDESAKTEIVLSITPRLIRPIAASRRQDPGFDAGTATGVRGRSDVEPGETAQAGLPPATAAAPAPSPPAAGAPGPLGFPSPPPAVNFPGGLR